ncbi:hypothetical protein AB1Y20_004666 [Prymnesium parvum]|uniref:Uncharacterized protein n=1 Tax=Prymnesium parvum TaxID=97485 RepID=A0AB34IX73_PRYPA
MVAVEEVVWMVEEAEEVVGRVALKVARVGMAALVVEVNLEVILEAEAAPESQSQIRGEEAISADLVEVEEVYLGAEDMVARVETVALAEAAVCLALALWAEVLTEGTEEMEEN